jgi:hypothetical protein
MYPGSPYINIFAMLSTRVFQFSLLVSWGYLFDVVFLAHVVHRLPVDK